MKSKGGALALTQDKHNNDTMPGHCQGCAWAVLGECTVFNSPWRSHPVRVRGLKPGIVLELFGQAEVAPRAGAWVETSGSGFPWF